MGMGMQYLKGDVSDVKGPLQLKDGAKEAIASIKERFLRERGQSLSRGHGGGGGVGVGRRESGCGEVVLSCSCVQTCNTNCPHDPLHSWKAQVP